MPMTWDEFQKTIGWNNTDAVRGMQALANKAGYSGPVQERTGRQVSTGEGESGPMMADEWGPAAGLSQAMGGYQFGQGSEDDGDPTAQIYRGDGSLLDSARVGSNGGSMMNFMSKAIPALTLAGFGAGAYGLLGGGGAAAGAGEAAGLAGTGADAATSAAWANGAAGLGGDTLTAMGMGEAGVGGLGTVGGGLSASSAGTTGIASNSSWLGAGGAGLGSGTGITAPLYAGGSELGMTAGAAAAEGGAGSGLLGAAGSAASWMKANPTLGKLLLSGGMGLLSSSGGGGSGSAPEQTYGPAKQWSSPIQQGIQSNPQQMNPAPIQQRPAGLLAQGQQNDGAWRFLGGK